MGLFDLLRKPWFGKVILILWLFCSVLLVFLLRMIDSIVHGELYSFGLQFNVAWANPYWNAMHLVYVLLAVPAFLSVIVLIASFTTTSDYRVVKRSNRVDKGQFRIARNQSVPVKCTYCGKVFRKPKTMLTLKNGKLQSADVCPYCEHVLGKTDERHPDESVRMESDEEEIQTE